MLKFSRKQDYALVLMTIISESNTPVSLNQVSKTTKLPLSILRQLANKLRLANLIESKEGVNGGYRLSKSATEITFEQIIVAIDGQLALTACSSNNELCVATPFCPIAEKLQKINTVIRHELQSITLDEVCRGTNA